MTVSLTLLRRRSFFYDHAMNLSVVGNDRHKVRFAFDPPARPWSTSKTSLSRLSTSCIASAEPDI